MENQLPSNFSAHAFLTAASSRLSWRRSLSEKLYPVWLGLMLFAIVAAGFTVSYFAFTRLVSHGSATSVEAYGD